MRAAAASGLLLALAAQAASSEYVRFAAVDRDGDAFSTECSYGYKGGEMVSKTCGNTTERPDFASHSTWVERDLETVEGHLGWESAKITLPKMVEPREPRMEDSLLLMHNARRAAMLDGGVNASMEATELMSKLKDNVDVVPFPPSMWFDINNMTTHAVLQRLMLVRMQTWNLGAGLYEWTGWWQHPVLAMALASSDIALGQNLSKPVAEDLYIKNSADNFIIDKYIDDQAWWGLAASAGYQAYGNESWLDSAKYIAHNNSLYWNETCGGGILWLTYRPQYRNTVTNSLYFSSLTRLYRQTGDVQYYENALSTLNWWLGWAFDPDTGKVHDTITAPDCRVTGTQSWSYNSGIILFGLADLYYITGDDKILDLARTIAYAAIRDFSDESTGILVESCENDPPPRPDLPPGCQQDEVLFKGILTLGMAYLFAARPDVNLYNYINTQMLSNVYNNFDSSWLAGEWWQGPWNETTAGPKTQINVLTLLSAATIVNGKFLDLTQDNSAAEPTAAVLTPVTAPTTTRPSDSAAGNTNHERRATILYERYAAAAVRSAVAASRPTL